MEIITMTQRQVVLHMSQCSHTRAQDLLLYTQEAACCVRRRHFAKLQIHLWSRNKGQELSNRLSDNVLLLQSAGWKLILLKVFDLPAIAPSFFFPVTSLFALRCATGVMLRVCCVICCYASTSGMWLLSLFYSLAVKRGPTILSRP